MSNCTLHVRSPQGLIYRIPVGSEPARGLLHQLLGSVVLALELLQEQYGQGEGLAVVTGRSCPCALRIMAADLRTRWLSSDHLVGQEQEGWGKRDPKRLGSLEVEDQLVLCRLLYGQGGGLGAFRILST